MGMDDIDFVFFHQANRYILEYLREKIGIPKEKFYMDLSRTGNTVSSSLPIALRDAMSTGLIEKGQKILLAGFGVGYSWGGTILQL